MQACLPVTHYIHEDLAPVENLVEDTSFSFFHFQRNLLTLPGYLPMENGYCRMPDGSFFVAARTEFPTATDEMFDWWFEWHAQEPFRYHIWYPECHFDVKVKVLQPPSPNQPSYWHTIHYPVEDIGFGKERLSIHFVPPAEFGFDVSRFAEAKIVTAICGLVGSVDKHLKQQAYMCHLVRRFSGGFEMRSRFWIGRDIRLNPFIGSAIVEKLVNTRVARMLSLPSRMGLAMALHCAQEYNNLSEILPELYVVYEQL